MEKDRTQKQIQNIQDEYDQRLRDEQTHHEDDMEMLQEEMRENEQRHQMYVN